MTVEVDKVYRAVLSILNKEQRGSMSPDEFNRVAKQAQLSIIEKTIHDYNEALNMRKAKMTNMGAANTPDYFRQKLEHLIQSSNLTFSTGELTLPNTAHWVLDIVSSGRNNRYEKLSKQEAVDVMASPLVSPSVNHPIFYFDTLGTVAKVLPNVAPLSTAQVEVDYIKTPDEPRWGYFENEDFGNFEYDSNAYDANAIVIKDDLWTTFSQNVSNGIDGEYSVQGAMQGGGTVDMRVTVSGGVVVAATPQNVTGTPAVGGSITVGTVLTTANGVDIPVSGVSGDLIITISETDLYSGSTGGSTNFILHPSQDVDLVLEILAYSGIVINRPEITQMASQLMVASETQKQ